MGANVRKRLAHKLTDVFEIPKDVVLDLPRITVVGDAQVVIENHRGVIEYSRQKVRINTTLGELLVAGAGLVIANILTEQIVIEGKVAKLEFSGWGGLESV